MDKTTTITGIEQGRAKKAFEFATKGNKEKQYDSYVKKIPMLIKTNGLGATYAFVKSKENENAYKLIYLQTAEWLRLKGLIGEKELIEEIVSKDSLTYRLITNEILALFNWLRRFVKEQNEIKSGA